MMSIENLSLSSSRIIDCLHRDYGIEVAALRWLPLGADMNASVYKAEAFDGVSYFIKLKKGHNDTSLKILAWLQDSGIQHIIPPIKTLFGKPSQQIDSFTLIVYPFIEGQNGFCRSLADEEWVMFGKLLRQIHELEVPPSIKNQIKRETYSSKWREAVRSLYAHIYRNNLKNRFLPASAWQQIFGLHSRLALEQCRSLQAQKFAPPPWHIPDSSGYFGIDSPLNGDETALKFQAFMKERKAVIHHLVDRAEALRQKIEGQSPDFVLCHADIHAGNVFIDGRGVLYIVDWDEPMMAPKERDLMFIGGGVANVWNEGREEELFYKGYGKTRIDKTILAYYRYERIVEDVALFGQALLLSHDGGKDRAEMYKQFLDMFEPRGVVDIALKTDEGFLRIYTEPT